MQTLVKYFFSAMQERAGQTMLRPIDDRSWTYEQVGRRVAAATHQLREQGLDDGDRIVAYCENTIPLTFLYLACAQIGILPVPISPVFSPSYLREVVRQAGANAIYTEANELGRVAQLGLPTFVWESRPVDEISRPVAEFGGHLDRIQRLFDEDSSVSEALEQLEKAAEEFQLEDSFLVQPTSGSTGRPKLVLRTFQAFSRYAQFVGDEVLKATGGEPFEMLAVNALTHAFAGHMFTMGVRLGATFCIPSTIDAPTKLEEVRRLNPHVLPMTPRVLRSFIKQASSQREDGDGNNNDGKVFADRAKLLLSAGGKGDVDSFKRLQTEGVEVCEFYGSSEASIMALTPYKKWKPDHAGIPVPDVEFHMSRDGEILVRSPGLFLGYLGDTHLTTLVFNDDEYYRTGDVGRIEEDGYLRIMGRKRDMFNTPEGTNIYPERIEIRLEALRWVNQAMLIGDGRPYITAHLVIRGSEERESHEDGAISQSEGDLFRRVGAEIAILNEELEHIERITAFHLYSRPFDTRGYASLAAGKVKRDRAAFMEIYAQRVEELYSLPHDSPHLVPPGERRYAERSAKAILF